MARGRLRRATSVVYRLWPAKRLTVVSHEASSSGLERDDLERRDDAMSRMVRCRVCLPGLGQATRVSGLAKLWVDCYQLAEARIAASAIRRCAVRIGSR